MRYRFLEAYTILPLIHLPLQPISVAVFGAHAPHLTLELLRWPEIRRVFTPRIFNLPRPDARVHWNLPLKNSCHLVLCSPNMSWKKAVSFLHPSGLLVASLTSLAHVPVFYAEIRNFFPGYAPWREYCPDPLYGVLATLNTKPQRYRDPPKSTKRITKQYLPCLFTFGKDEMAWIFGPNPSLENSS